MMGLDPTAVVRILSSLARGLGTVAAFIQILPPLPTPATHPSLPWAAKQPAPHPCLPSFLHLRLSPGPFNLHSVGTAASFN